MSSSESLTGHYVSGCARFPEMAGWNFWDGLVMHYLPSICEALGSTASIGKYSLQFLLDQ